MANNPLEADQLCLLHGPSTPRRSASKRTSWAVEELRAVETGVSRWDYRYKMVHPPVVETSMSCSNPLGMCT
jgi:hypothetical protein